MDCFGTYFSHAQSCDNVAVQSATEWTASVHTLHIQTCDNVGVQSATEWTASVHTLHMPKAVITFVFQVLRMDCFGKRLYTCPKLWSRLCSKWYGMDCFGKRLYTCPKLWSRLCSKWYRMDCLGTYFTRAQAVIAFVFKVLRNGLLRYILYTWPMLW